MGGAPSAIAYENWKDECAKQFVCGSPGLVNNLGQPIPFANCSDNNSRPPSVAWGVTATACEEKCGSDRMIQGFTFNHNAVTLSTWLFPFIALIAQLPFEARGSSFNFLSGCMALGSPAIVTYSLCLTVLNRRYMSKQFAKLKQSARVRNLPRHVIEMIEDAALVISEARQAPLRVSNKDGWLTSLVNLEGNRKFWRSVAKDLRNSSRGFTYSFFAQASFAFIAYLFSFISVYIESLGVISIGLQFSTSMVWSWMFPVVIGYVLVRSQMRAGAIEDALEKRALLRIGDTDPVKKPPFSQLGIRQVSSRSFHEEGDGDETEAESDTDDFARPTTDYLPSIQVHDHPASLNSLGLGNLPSSPTALVDLALPSPALLSPSPTSPPLTYPPSPAISDTEAAGDLIQGGSTQFLPSHNSEDGPCPTWYGLDLQGDELVEGPIFNYARVFTWYQLGRHIHRAFSQTVHTFDPSQPVSSNADWVSRNQRLRIFEPFSKINPRIYYDMFWASIMAILLQWGTTGAAILTAFKTPVIGLGCHSGSYLLYSVLATFCWVVFVTSSILSHAVMVWHDEPSNAKLVPPRTIRVATAMAVCLRMFARGLVIINAGWLITFSVLEDIGFYQNCWCESLRLFVSKSKGWVAIFPDAKLSESIASGLWIGGFLMPIAISVVMLFFIYFARKPVKR